MRTRNHRNAGTTRTTARMRSSANTISQVGTMAQKNRLLSRKMRRWIGAFLCAAGCGASSQAIAQQPALPEPPVPQPLAAYEAAAPSAIPHPLEATQASVGFASAATTANSNAALEYRLRELEERYAEQSMKFASLAEEVKAAEKKEAAKGSVVGADNKMSGGWKDGAFLETGDKAFKMKWRGRTQFDTSGFSDSSNDYFQGLAGNQGDTAADFRRLRIGTEGTLYEQFDFAVELDFINTFNTNSIGTLANNANIKNAFDRQYLGVPAPTDVWIGMHEVPFVGNLRVGNIKPPNGLEHSNSSRFLDFMERSLCQDAFVGRFNNGFQPGVLFYNWNDEQTVTWANSVTANSYNVFAYEAGGPDIANRVTWTPIYDEESHGRYMLHLGISGTYRKPVDGLDRLRARGSLRNGISQSWSNVADTTPFFTTDEWLVIPEIAAVVGPWHFQAEYFGQFNQNVAVQGPGAFYNPGPVLGNAYFQGYYGQVSYFLTGEHREYERKAGAFGRVVPYENFHFIKSGRGGNILTRGSWQVLYRYNVLDLNDPTLADVNTAAGAVRGVGGGTVVDHTIGLNHFLNPNMKIQYNVLISDRGPSAATPATPLNNGAPNTPQVGGTAFGAGVRFAIDF
jgi:phosphate-selective porin OprO/OprP